MRRKNIHSLIGLGLICAGSAQAGSAVFDFNSDPTAGGLATIYGASTAWVPSGGAGYSTNSSDGYLQITPALNSQTGAIVFSDFDNGSIVGGFHMEADVRIGNGTGGTTPADGFCIAFARETDPALANPADSNQYAVDNGNAQGPEEGTRTGIAVGFDAYANGGTDIRGIDLRVDGALTVFAMPTLNGSVTDTTSIQTGPNDGTGSPDVLGWAHLIVDLSTNGNLNVYYKGKQMLTNYATGYVPGPGRLLVAGRTGGFNENQDVDNISISTFTISAAAGLVTGFADGFTFTINDSGPSVVNPSTISFKINNGASLTPTSVQKNGSVTTVVYHGYPTLLGSGSTNQLAISFKDTTGATLGGTRTFVVPTYNVVPASDAVASGVNTTAPGFRILPWESGNEPNRVYWANEQLAGLHGANNADLSGATDNGYIDFTGLINFNIGGINQGGGGDAGDFQTANSYPDQSFPGIPGANGLTGNSALEALAFVRFQNAGVYQMGVNSDDGFAVTEGHNPQDRLALNLGQFDGGRGSSDTIFTFVVPTAGIYPFRLLWYNGNGEAGNGANLEWFTVQPDGTKVLINDPSPTNTTGITAFYAGPALPPHVSQVIPYPGATGVRADLINLQLVDGGTQVNPSTVKLRLNGALVSPTVSKSGNTTTVSLVLDTSHLMAPGSNTASLVWSDGTLTASNNWSFVVAPYVTLDAGLSSPVGSVDLTQPGFVLKVTQLDPGVVGDSGDSIANQLDSSEGLLAGLYFPWYGANVADTAGGGAGGVPAVTNNIWFWTNAIDFNAVSSAGDFTYDYPVPGIPGTTAQANYYAAGFQSYVVFPTAGFYQMGVSSDDGFRVSEGLGVSRQALHVTGPGIDTDVAAVATYGGTGGNAGYGATLPLTPVTGPAVFVPVPCPNLPGAVNLANKIGVADYSSCPSGFSVHDLAYNLQTNGALAAIIINNPDYGLPFVGDGSGSPVTIPVLVVNGDFGQRDFWVTNSSLVASVGADAHIRLGEADYAKGMSHVDFGFVVPVAGAYPMRLFNWQGGGGAGLEWTSIVPGPTADGTRVLVNDSATPGSLLAYRAVTTRPHLNSPVAAGGNVTLSWTGAGILQKATQLNPGSWSDVTPQPAGSSYTIPSGGTAFYRLRVPTPVEP